MDLGAHIQRALRREFELFNQGRNGDETLVYYQVSIFGIFREPLVRIGIASEYEFEIVPLKDVLTGPSRE